MKLKSKVVDLKWITDCVKVGKLLNIEFYLVFGFQSNSLNFNNNDNNNNSDEEQSNRSNSKDKSNSENINKIPKIESKKFSKEYVKGNFSKKEDSKNTNSKLKKNLYELFYFRK